MWRCPVLPALTEWIERAAGLVFTGQYLEDGKESSEEDVQESHCHSPRFPRPGEGLEDKVSAWVLCPRNSQLPGMNMKISISLPEALLLSLSVPQAPALPRGS